MSEVSQSSSQEFYAVYSQKQFDHIQETNLNSHKKNKDFSYIYYEKYNNELVQITEIFHDKTSKSLFDDAVYLGKVKKFHSALSGPIPTLLPIKYEASIP
tara:strand:+ start:259 stop:558 length:300 start_codon:yes stop_codon:yes gene_type:complete